MKTARLVRTTTGDEGTFGTLTVDGHTFVSGELPDRANAPGISSIPAGSYLCKWQFSPKFQRDVYHLQDVPGRTVVEIHPGNVMGDKALGFKSDLNGCLALGMDRGVIDGQKAILNSREALDNFEKITAHQDFTLEIVDEYAETGAPEGATVA